MVVNESSEDLAEAFPEFFDRILIDAPCSGEGMFRKDPEARGQWSWRRCRPCAPPPGRPEWTKNSCRAVENTFRIWPHLTEGEGHYLALLEKEDDREYRAEGRENKTEEPKHRTERREYKSERKSKNKLPDKTRKSHGRIRQEEESCGNF